MKSCNLFCFGIWAGGRGVRGLFIVPNVDINTPFPQKESGEKTEKVRCHGLVFALVLLSLVYPFLGRCFEFGWLRKIYPFSAQFSPSILFIFFLFSSIFPLFVERLRQSVDILEGFSLVRRIFLLFFKPLP